jgi:hypothetical protein
MEIWGLDADGVRHSYPTMLDALKSATDVAIHLCGKVVFVREDGEWVLPTEDNKPKPADFAAMTVEEALDYCEKHKREFIAENDVREYDCLVLLIELGDIKPDDLPSYGMDY